MYKKYIFIILLCFSLTGCGIRDENRFGVSKNITKESNYVLHVWDLLLYLSLLIGGLVILFLIYNIVRYGHINKESTQIPKQTGENLIWEIFYTTIPILIVIFIFIVSSINQESIMRYSNTADVYNIGVVARQWSWSFNYNINQNKPHAFDVGQDTQYPVLYLPVNQRIHFYLTSLDVIHSFWVPAFLYKMDVIPNRLNKFEIIPTKLGVYPGRCAELCGMDHSMMLFYVHVVPVDQYWNHINYLIKNGYTGSISGEDK